MKSSTSNISRIVCNSQITRNVSIILEWISVNTKFSWSRRSHWIDCWGFFVFLIAISIHIYRFHTIFTFIFVLFVFIIINKLNYFWRLKFRFFVENNISTNIIFLYNRIEKPISLVFFVIIYRQIFFWIYFSLLVSLIFWYMSIIAFLFSKNS